MRREHVCGNTVQQKYLDCNENRFTDINDNNNIGVSTNAQNTPGCFDFRRSKPDRGSLPTRQAVQGNGEGSTYLVFFFSLSFKIQTQDNF